MRPVALLTAFAALAIGAGSTANSTSLNAADQDAAPVAAPAAAAQVLSPTDQMTAQLFSAFDYNNDGRVSPPEALSYLVLMLMSQDGDEDSRISRQEFHNWDVGFDSIARTNGRLREYAAQKDRLFQSWDSNGDQYLTVGEFVEGASRDFRAASNGQKGGIAAEAFAQVGFIKGLATAASS